MAAPGSAPPSSTSRSARRECIDVAVDAAREASDGVVVVVPAADAAREHGVAGGATRSASVRAGLAAVPDEATIVCVHDAARPLATPELFAAVIDAVRAGADGAVPAVPVTDTIKVVDADGRGRRHAGPQHARRRADAAGVPRRRAAARRTPRAARAPTTPRSSSASAAAWSSCRATWNRKITDPDDLEWARRWLAERTA